MHPITKSIEEPPLLAIRPYAQYRQQNDSFHDAPHRKASRSRCFARIFSSSHLVFETLSGPLRERTRRLCVPGTSHLNFGSIVEGRLGATSTFQRKESLSGDSPIDVVSSDVQSNPVDVEPFNEERLPDGGPNFKRHTAAAAAADGTEKGESSSLKPLIQAMHVMSLKTCYMNIPLIDVGATIVGTSVVRASVVGASVVGASAVGASVVGDSVVGASVVGASQ